MNYLKGFSVHNLFFKNNGTVKNIPTISLFYFKNEKTKANILREKNAIMSNVNKHFKTNKYLYIQKKDLTEYKDIMNILRKKTIFNLNC